jgi:predicted flavoprotein YhiN
MKKATMDIGIIGGGAAGFFSAIRIAELNPLARVFIFERGRSVLEKVRISGGGRCNVTHDCSDPIQLIGHYPRGGRELLGPFTRFGPNEVVEWFSSRGVELKTEPDGRVFPKTNNSQTIVDCLIRCAQDAGYKPRNTAGGHSTVFRPVETKNTGRGAVFLQDRCGYRK